VMVSPVILYAGIGGIGYKIKNIAGYVDGVGPYYELSVFNKEFRPIITALRTIY
jgi:hypothetical protein